MHYHNRVTGFNDAYFARKNEAFDHGHVVVGTFEVNYEKYEGFESRAALSFPHLPPNQWYMIDLFPGMNFNLRGSALRCDVVTPLGPDKVMIEFSGLGLKRDTAGGTPDARSTTTTRSGARSGATCTRICIGVHRARARPCCPARSRAASCTAATRTRPSTTRTACAITTTSGAAG